MAATLSENLGIFRKVLDAVESLRPFDASGLLSCNIPEIVVVGDQSSGKTSVIESLLGLELPTGGNIVTRVPLRVQLRQEPQFNAQVSWTGEDGQPVVIDNIRKEDIAQRIDEATKLITGGDFQIVDVPLQLSAQGPEYLNFTFTDLPGITRVPVGQQPPDIETITKELILKYIRGQSKVILCTCPANVDVSTNGALALASSVDQSKSRTFGLITKADCASQITIDHLRNTNSLGSKFNMPLGFIAVRCRSQEEKENGTTIQEARAVEENFFASESSPFKDVDKSLLGFPSLVKQLEKLMRTQVKLQLPEICAQVDRLIDSKESILNTLTGPAKTEREAVKKIESYSLNIVRQFQERVECKILDELNSLTADIHAENQAYAEKVDQITSNILTDEFLRKVEATSCKVQGRGFAEDQHHLVFEESARSWICQQLIKPSLDLADNIRRQTECFLYELINIEVGNFPMLTDTYMRLVEDFLKAQRMLARDYIEDIIRCHNELFSLRSTVGSDLYTQGQEEWAILANLHETRNLALREKGDGPMSLKGMIKKNFLYCNHSALEDAASRQIYPFQFNGSVVQSESDIDWLEKRLEISGTKESVATQFRVANYSRQVRLIMRELIPRLVRRNMLTKAYHDDALFKSFSAHFEELRGDLLVLFGQGPDTAQVMADCQDHLSILKDAQMVLRHV